MSYCVNGEIVFSESDEDGDGFLESIMISTGKEMSEFYKFKRDKALVVTPIPVKENTKLQEDAQKKMNFFDNCLEGVEKEQTITPSKD